MSEPRDVIHWSNGMVAVFDAAGCQMADLQGRYANVRESVLEAAGPGTRFYVAKWGEWKQSVTREEWAAPTPPPAAPPAAVRGSGEKA